MKQEVSISFLSHPDPLKTQQQIEAVTLYPFHTLSIYEDLGYPHPHGQLLQFAQRCPRIERFGVAGNVVARLTSLDGIVGQITELNNYSAGRAYLGLVPGAWMEQIGIKPAGLDKMREAIGAYQYLVHHQTQGFEGKYFTVKPGFTLQYETAKNVPLLIGAWGEKMVSLAGELADEVKVGGSSNPNMVSVIQERLRPGLEKSGRGLDDVGIVFGAVTVIDDDRQRAIKLAKRKAVIYIDAIGEKDLEVMQNYPDDLFNIKQSMSRGDIHEAIRFLSPELVKKFMFVGTPVDIIHQTEELFSRGVRRVEYGSPHGVDPFRGIQLLGQQVVPYFN